MTRNTFTEEDYKIIDILNEFEYIYFFSIYFDSKRGTYHLDDDVQRLIDKLDNLLSTKIKFYKTRGGLGIKNAKKVKGTPYAESGYVCEYIRGDWVTLLDSSTDIVSKLYYILQLVGFSESYALRLIESSRLKSYNIKRKVEPLRYKY